MTSGINDSTQDLRENVPLRKPDSKRNAIWDCLNILTCQDGKQNCLHGIGLIYSSFAIFSIVITFILFAQIYYGTYQVEPHGKVTTDDIQCSSIGVQILKKGGNAVDAAIAATICLAVVNPHTTGLAAGGSLMVYSHRLRIVPDVINFGSSIKLDTEALPRLIVGLAYAHYMFGKLPWNILLQPSIELARDGFWVPGTLLTAIELSNAYNLYKHPLSGQKMVLPTLAHTLQTIANISEDTLHSLVASNEQLMVTPALNGVFRQYNVYVPNAPANGGVLLAALDNLYEYNVSSSNIDEANYTRRIAEAILTTYKQMNISKRWYENTASSVVVADVDDLYATVVTGLNEMLGTQNVLPDGYLIDEVADTNAETTALPVILTDANYVCGRRIIFGTGDNSLALQIVTSLLIGNKNITDVIEEPRFRILKAKEIGIEDKHEPTFSDQVRMELKSLGELIALSEPFDSVNLIQITGDVAQVVADSRGGGTPSQF